MKTLILFIAMPLIYLAFISLSFKGTTLMEKLETLMEMICDGVITITILVTLMSVIYTVLKFFVVG